MREITAEEQGIINKKIELKRVLFMLDRLDEGESVFVENDSVPNIQYLYLAMKRKGKKFTQIKQAIGYTLTRISL
jgi:uncharacterized protein (DUF2249 family)